MPRSKRLKLYEYVGELVDAGVEVLTQRLQLPADQARDVMLQVAKGVCFKNASSTVYIPAAVNLQNLERNAQLWAEYQQDNPAPPYTRKFSPQRALELAAKYELSPQQVYNILRDQRDAEIDERQGSIEL